MYNLGISCYYHDSAAAILKDGHTVAAVEEERFSRKKFDDGFPNLAIDWCLKAIGIRPEEIDSIAFYDKPVLKFDRLLDNYIINCYDWSNCSFTKRANCFHLSDLT